jgi:hypothetical protein
MAMNHYVSGISFHWPTRAKPFVVFLGSIPTAEFVPKFHVEREGFLCSLLNVNIKIRPHCSKGPNSILSTALSPKTNHLQCLTSSLSYLYQKCVGHCVGRLRLQNILSSPATNRVCLVTFHFALLSVTAPLV